MPIDEFAANLKEMVHQVRAAGIVPIIMTPGPLVDHRFPGGFRLNSRHGMYAAAAVAAAKEVGVQYVDLWTRIQQAPQWQTALMLPDGLHMNQAGHRFVRNAVLEAIGAAAPEMLSPALPIHFPRHNSIDFAHPERSFEPVLGRYIQASSAADDVTAAAADDAAALDDVTAGVADEVSDAIYAGAP